MDALLADLKNRLEIVPDSVTSKHLVDQLVALGPQEEPLHLVELDNLIKQHYAWLRHLPRVNPFYAIKSNDEPSIVATSVLLGLGYDCASKSELERVLTKGVKSEKIIFAQPAKTIDALKFARESKVRTVFDSEFELRKIQKYYPDAELLIRYKFDAKNSRATLGTKFGCNPDTEAPRLLQLAKELGLNVVGWCFNVGSACSDADIFYHAIKKGRQLCDLAATIGFHFKFLDLGGGFAGDIKKYAVHINAALDEFFPNDEGYSIIAEPGRYYCAATSTNVVSIHGKKVLYSAEDPAQIEHVYYYLNDGISGTFYGVRSDNDPVNPIAWKDISSSQPRYKTTFFGPTCDNGDRFGMGIELPELNISDSLAFPNHGAYTRVYATSFNGFCLPKSVVFIRQSSWELLEQLSTCKNPLEALLNSAHLQQNHAIGELKFSKSVEK